MIIQSVDKSFIYSQQREKCGEINVQWSEILAAMQIILRIVTIQYWWWFWQDIGTWPNWHWKSLYDCFEHLSYFLSLTLNFNHFTRVRTRRHWLQDLVWLGLRKEFLMNKIKYLFLRYISWTFLKKLDIPKVKKSHGPLWTVRVCNVWCDVCNFHSFKEQLL